MKSMTYLSVLVSLLVLFVAANPLWAQSDPHQHAHAAHVEAAGKAEMPCAKMGAVPCPHCPKMTDGGMPCPHCPHCPKMKEGAMPCPNCPMMKDGGKPCPHCPKMTGHPCVHKKGGAMPCDKMTGMPHHGMSHHPMMGSMMVEKMDREFFLDRKETLGLSDDQVEKLQAIQSSCREDNMKRMSEVREAHMQLAKLLKGDWSLDEAEKLVRRSQKLEADMMVRHLEAKKAAQDVLTADQLEKARQAPAEEDLEDLFR